MAIAEPLGKRAGKRALACARRAINGDNHWSLREVSAAMPIDRLTD